MIARVWLLALAGMAAACSPAPPQPADEKPATPVPLLAQPSTPPAPAPVQLGEAPRLKEEPR